MKKVYQIPEVYVEDIFEEESLLTASGDIGGKQSNPSEGDYPPFDPEE